MSAPPMPPLTVEQASVLLDVLTNAAVQTYGEAIFA